ncbi:MAG: hypothetical protein KJ915_13290 [Candidatus Omnitrophica bacterium]|nr:hypothetical protein [Candidatus Omnitrophota bacterium]
MDNKHKKLAQREEEKRQFIVLIMFLIILFCGLLFMNKRFRPKINHKPSEFEEDVKTYDGSLQRNISNPFGVE